MVDCSSTSVSQRSSHRRPASATLTLWLSGTWVPARSSPVTPTWKLSVCCFASKVDMRGLPSWRVYSAIQAWPLEPSWLVQVLYLTDIVVAFSNKCEQTRIGAKFWVRHFPTKIASEPNKSRESHCL